MILKPMIAARDALEWEENFSRHRPPPPDGSDKMAYLVSFNTRAAADGIMLNLRTTNGNLEIFVNAVAANFMVSRIRELGIACLWMNEDDASLIVKDPENLVYHGRKS